MKKLCKFLMKRYNDRYPLAEKVGMTHKYGELIVLFMLVAVGKMASFYDK